jgi:hypothetical protein
VDVEREAGGPAILRLALEIDPGTLEYRARHEPLSAAGAGACATFAGA